MGAVIYFLLSRMELWLLAMIAYFLGCFNGAVLVSKYILRDDVRSHGSGNAGLTNFHRTFGGWLTFGVILCDMLKAVAALLIARWLAAGFDPRLMPDLPLDTVTAEYYMVLFQYWAALFCLLGHMFPCMFQFKGGKGILSGGAIALMIDWRVALVVWGGWLLWVVLTRYVSLGSVWAGGCFPFITWYCYPDPIIVGLAFLAGGLVVWQHRGNIQRLVSGTERKLSFRKKKEGTS